VSYQLRSSGVHVRLDLDEKQPEVIADFDQMVQVFVNLFVNAEHAMREIPDNRALSVSTSVTRNGHAVVAEVGDTGPGIRPEVLPRIFEPFFTTKPAGLGTGVGLAVSFGMVSAHDGLLEAVVQPGQSGACFRLTLPVGQNRVPAAQEKSAPEQSPAGKRILIVDDEPEIVSLLRDILEKAGHQVEHAEHGLEALARVEQSRFDAIFCDLRMPGLDGRGLRRRLMSSHPVYERRMIFVTGDLLGANGGSETIDGCPVIEKPFYARTVLSELARVPTVA
jgi:CheY-like chemotaxis protein